MVSRFFTRLISLINSLTRGRYFIGIVGIAAVITMTISLYVGLNQSVWFDEGYSIMVAQQPLPELMKLVAVDAHPPLYYVLLKAWMAIFGTSEFALRASSILCGGLALVVMALLMRNLFSVRIALIVLPFVTFAPFLLRYNYEIRMYAFVTLIGVLATWVLVRAWRSQKAKWWITYGVLVAIGMYTLYMSAAFWLAHLAWLIMMTYQAKKNIFKQAYWLSYIGAALVFIPWVPTVLSQLSSSALPPYMNRVDLRELSNVTGLLMTYTPVWQIRIGLGITLTLLLATFVYVFIQVWRRVSKEQKQGILLLAAGFVVGMLFYAAISIPPNPPRFIDRYVVHISIFWYALLGVIIAYGWHLRLKLSIYILTALATLVIGMGVTKVWQVGNYNFQRVQYFQGETIRQQIGCKDTTFVTAGPFGYIDMKYNLDGCSVKFYYPWDVTLLGGFAPADKSADRIKTTDTITTSRIAYIYYDDSDVSLTPDARFQEVARRSFDKAHVIIYAR